MMCQKEEFSYGETDSAQVLKLPYSGRSLCMLIVLPKNCDGLDDLETGLDAKQIDTWSRSLLHGSNYLARTYLPRFRMEQEMGLEQPLKEMGSEGIFSQEADFKGMSKKEPLFLGAAMHRAGVVVDEKGTETWAVTGMVNIASIGPPEPPRRVVFRADHPFLFFIMDAQHDLILFIGRVIRPS